VRAQACKEKRLSYREEVRGIIKTEGVYGLTRGYSGLALSAVPGMGFFYAFFDTLKMKLDVTSPQRHELIALKKFVAAGFASGVCWLYAYPIDMVKARMQSLRGPRVSLMTMAREMYLKYGIGYFYRGIHVQIFRVLPQDATSLLVYDTVREFLLRDIQ